MTRIDAISVALAQTSARGQEQTKTSRAVSSQSTTASLQQISRTAQQFVSGISRNPKISTEVKQQLIDVAAIIDTFLNNPSVRHSLFRDLAGIGVFVGNQSTTDYPDYPVMTGLRYYGVQQIALADVAPPAPSMQEIFTEISMKMAEIVTSSGGESVDVALTQVANDPGARQAVAELVSLDTQVTGVGSGGGDTGGDQPAPVVTTETVA